LPALARTFRDGQIPRVISHAAPYSLVPPRFRFRALAALAGRAPLGGVREVALAVYLAARLTDDARPSRALPPTTRVARATAARSWLSAMALPASTRTALARLVDATAGEGEALAAALRNVITVTADALDAGAHSELEKLAQTLTE
jgi:hypothetical protein